MTRDLSRPSGYARWGWAWAAVAFLGGVPNIMFAFSEPTGLRIGLGGFTVVVTIGLMALWRDGVKSDRSHRALMAQLDRQISQWGDLR